MLAVPDAITSDSVIWQILFGTGVEPYMTSGFLTDRRLFKFEVFGASPSRVIVRSRKGMQCIRNVQRRVLVLTPKQIRRLSHFQQIAVRYTTTKATNAISHCVQRASK